jgi:hypothetical protein
MADTYVAAYEITTCSVGYFDSTTGGDPFGFALHTYGKITHTGEHGKTYPTFGAGTTNVGGDAEVIVV